MRLSRHLACAIGSVLPLLVSGPATAGSHLKVSVASAVPGQVIVLSAPGLAAGGAEVTIGGEIAQEARREGAGVAVVVPSLRPGPQKVIALFAGQRLSARLRIKRAFGGFVKAVLNRARARTETIGPDGGTVTAKGADGTRYALSIPAGALVAATLITLTPLSSIGGIPLTGHPVAVQFAPEGLVFETPASLEITRSRTAPPTAIGFAYAADGAALSLAGAARSGRTLTMAIEHFSGAGTGTVTVDRFLRLVARLLIGQLTLADVDEFLHQLKIVQRVLGDFCLTEATCTEVMRRSTALLENETASFSCLSPDTPTGVLLDQLRSQLRIEGDLRLVGTPRLAAAADESAGFRECMTGTLVNEAEGPAKTDPLGLSSIAAGASAADRSNADVDRDGEVSNVEWALFVAGLAAQQGFGSLQARATTAFEEGLKKVLDDGIARCEESFPEGKSLLGKGQKVADATLILASEFASAVADCKPKIFVTPKSVSVETGGTQGFTARSNDGDTSFVWSTSDGTIDQSGQLTAPTTPGPVTVTAAAAGRPVLTGNATVTVTCPVGQIEEAGRCNTVAITVDPTAVSIAPGATTRFTATVTGTTDTRVTWSETGPGTITQQTTTDPGGLYTAPQAPGTYTVTVASLRDPTKQATAMVSVTGGCRGVTRLGNRGDALARLGSPGGPNCQARVSSPGVIEFTGTSSCAGAEGEFQGSSTVTTSFTERYAGSELATATASISGSVTGNDGAGILGNYYLDLSVTETTDLSMEGSLDFDAEVSSTGRVFVMRRIPVLEFVIDDWDHGPFNYRMTLTPGEYSIRMAINTSTSSMNASVRLTCPP